MMKHELLAPAGNIEAGYAALYYGADAVYLGLKKYSARAGADNFSFEELDEFTAYAHKLNRKVFVALNTILTEAEINELPEIIAGLKKCCVDALIVQDLGVIYLLKKLAPEIELHASTQMAVHNLEGARFLQSQGFKRVVLARELSLSEIKKIAAALPDLDLEVFVHGALCYSYSGQCLFSALEYGKSANRGRCAYPCRNEYTLDDGIKAHLFSMKDLALQKDVLKLPVLSLKIEGRKKSPLYVAAVTNYYRHILDGKEKLAKEAEDIRQIFSRPWCTFHFHTKDKNVVDREFVGHRGLLIAKVEKIAANKLYFIPSRSVARYDGLQIDVSGSEKPFGFGIKNLYVNNKPVFEAKKGEYIAVELPPEHPHINSGAPIYLASSTAVKGRYDYQKPKPKEYANNIAEDVRIEILKDKVWAMSGNVSTSVDGNFETAKDEAKTIAACHNAFAKTGGTGIVFNKIDVKNNDKRFVPVSLLNELRRNLVEELKTSLADNPIAELPTLKPYSKKQEAPQKIKVIPITLDEKNIVSAIDDSTWFLLPQICRDTDKLKKVTDNLYQQGVRQFIVDNYYGFDLLKNYQNITIAAGSFLYVMNRYAAASLKQMGAKWATMALESSPENMKELLKTSPLPLVQITSSHVPLFTSAVCIRNNDCAHCTRVKKTWKLKQSGREYIAVSENCELKLYNQEKYRREAVAGVWGIISDE